MKKTFCLIGVILVVIFACRQQPKMLAVNIEAEKTAISSLFDKYNSAINSKNVNTMASLFADDGLFCGTDPTEFWDKKAIVDGWNQTAADTSLKLNYSIDRREIRVDKDGNSGIVIEQYIMSVLSRKISIRSIYHVVKTGDTWIIDFVSWNFIPKNEDIAKLNKAME